jgi:hypothetical protein
MERTKEFQDIIEQAGLDWNVRSETVQTTSGIIIPKAIALVREDTNKILGTHKESYCMYQNEEMLDLLFKISNSTGRKLKGGGSFGDGEKIFYQLESDSLTLGTDRIDGSITGINSYDGSTSLSFGNSNVTISCMNSFFMAYKTLGTKFRHSSTMRPKIEEILKQITILESEEKETFRTITRMAGIEMDESVKELVTRMLFDIKEQDKQATDEEIKELSTRKMNNIIRFGFDWDIETAQKGNTLWGAFSSLTRYTSHSMKKGGNEEAKLFGAVGVKERQIFSTLAEMV